MPKIRATTIEEHKERTREDILEWAEKLFVTQDYGKTSLGDVADAVGIGRTTLYEYFPNKDHLVLALIETVIPPRIQPIMVDLPESASFARLSELLRRIVNVVADDPALSSLVFSVGRKLPAPMQERMWHILDPILETIAEACVQGVASGEFAPGDPELITRAVADVFVGAADEVVRKDRPKERAKQVLELYVPFLERGLGVGATR